MGINVSKIQGGGGDFVPQELLEPDTYAARLVQVIDLGLQPQSYLGQAKEPANMIQLTYELSEEFMKDENGEDIEDKPRWLHEQLALHSLKADKAKSTLRYNALDPDHEFEGDFGKCLGNPVNVIVVNNYSKATNKTYNNVGGVSQMSTKKAAKLPELVNKPVVFDLDSPDIEVFNAFPDWLKDKIRSNLNFQGSPLAKLLGSSGSAKPVPKPVDADKQRSKKQSEDSEDSDDHPY